MPPYTNQDEDLFGLVGRLVLSDDEDSVVYGNDRPPIHVPLVGVKVEVSTILVPIDPVAQFSTQLQSSHQTLSLPLKF